MRPHKKICLLAAAPIFTVLSAAAAAEPAGFTVAPYSLELESTLGAADTRNHLARESISDRLDLALTFENRFAYEFASQRLTHTLGINVTRDVYEDGAFRLYIFGRVYGGNRIANYRQFLAQAQAGFGAEAGLGAAYQLARRIEIFAEIHTGVSHFDKRTESASRWGGGLRVKPPGRKRSVLDG